MGDEEPGFGGFDRLLEVFGQPPAAADPCEGAFYDPAPRQQFEALGSVGALDDLDVKRPSLASSPTSFGPW